MAPVNCPLPPICCRHNHQGHKSSTEILEIVVFVEALGRVDCAATNCHAQDRKNIEHKEQQQAHVPQRGQRQHERREELLQGVNLLDQPQTSANSQNPECAGQRHQAASGWHHELHVASDHQGEVEAERDRRPACHVPETKNTHGNLQSVNDNKSHVQKIHQLIPSRIRGVVLRGHGQCVHDDHSQNKRSEPGMRRCGVA
mmetsp:Transcript_80113/g.183546  ORF Transcript_80113/g.183546 Transcript_80113/m.183546 type:complete len:200 (-) Transcript_80113:694-1293(-)